MGDSSNWSACVLLHSRHASHCTILLISSALCTCTHTHKLSHFFTVSLTAFRHGVTPHFARRFAHTIALLVCLCVCVCRRAAGVMDCRSKWRHMDICSAHPIKVSRIRSAVLFMLISNSLNCLLCVCLRQAEMCIPFLAGAAHSLSGVSIFRSGPRLVFLQSPAERPAVWPAVPSAQHRGCVSGTDSHTCFTSL